MRFTDRRFVPLCLLLVLAACLSHRAECAPDENITKTGEATKRQSRKFVRNWAVKDLKRDLYRLNEGRSFQKGKELFKVASCVKCHRINAAGGTLGPDLSGVAGRNSRVVILNEIIEPSKKIPAIYQSHKVLTASGKVHVGLIVQQDSTHLHLVSDPSQPDQRLEILRDEIEEKALSTVSIMPGGLLDTLSKEEILDLLAYVDSGGQEDHPAYD